jgi:hypothetical protein
VFYANNLNKLGRQAAMKWKVEFDQSLNYVRVSGIDIFDVNLQPVIYRDILSRRFWEPGTALLFDNRNVDFGQSGIERMRRASRNYIKFARYFGTGKMALLMKSLVDFGRGRQFEMLSESKGGCRIRSFLLEEEALEWLLASENQKVDTDKCFLRPTTRLF